MDSQIHRRYTQLGVNKILLTGGTGILGSQMIKEWENDSNVEVCSPSRAELDITCHRSVQEFFDNNVVDIILHCAAYTDTVSAINQIEDCVDANVIGTWNLLRESMSQDIRFVYISTDYVFDGTQGEYQVSSPINPIGNYSMSKAAAELIVRMYNNSLSIRTSFVPKDFPHPAAFSDQYTTRDYVDVISKFIKNLTTSNKLGIVHVGTKKKSVFELAKQRRRDVKKISIHQMDFHLPEDTSLSDLELGEKNEIK